MKRRLIIASVIVLCALSCLWAQASGESMAKDTRELVAFTDDLGRTVMVPEDIDSVTPTGSTAQVILLTFDPDRRADDGNGRSRVRIPSWPV